MPLGSRRGLLLLLTLLLVAALAAPVQPFLTSTRFLLEILPGAPVPTLDWPPVHSRQIVFAGGEGERTATLFLPAAGRHPGAVLVPGTQLRLEDPSVRRPLEALARLGLVVVIPDAGELFLAREDPHEAAQELISGSDPYETEALVGAFRYLQDQQYVLDRRVGFMGFSVGASLAAIAAADPRINREVAFLHWFGGYYDATEVVIRLVTRQVADGSREVHWSPRPWAVDRVARGLLELAVDDEDERAALEEMLDQGPSPVPAGLSQAGSRARDLLWATSPAQARAALAAFPAPVLSSLRGVSPSAHVGGLLAPTFVLHDRNDPFVPVAESRRLWAALPAAQRASYAEVSLFDHVTLSRSIDSGALLADAPTLIRHFAAFIAVMNTSPLPSAP